MIARLFDLIGDADAWVDTKKVDPAEFRDIDPELDSFFSCDTPERYDEALRREPGTG